MAVDAGTLYLNVRPNLATLQKELSTGMAAAGTTATKSLSKSLASAGSKLSSVGKSLTRTVTLPIVGVGALATKMALDFDDAFTKIAAVSNASQDDLERWRGDVLRLSGETARSPEELADALYFLASAGLRTNEVMPTLEQSAKAAASGLGETQDIARLTANVLNAYAESGLRAADVTDTLVAAVREGTADPAEFADAMGRILPIASKAKVGFDDVAASLAALSNIGLPVTEGVTAIRGLLQSMIAPTSAAGEELKKIGLNAEDLRRVLAEGGLPAALDLLEQKTGGNIDTLRKIIPNIRSLTGELGLTGENADKVSAIFDAVRDSTGSMGDAFNTTAKSPAFQLRQNLNELRVAGIELGNQLIPIATQIADAVGNVAKAFGDLSPEMQQTILKVAGIAAVTPLVLRFTGALLSVAGAGASAASWIARVGGAASESASTGLIAGAGAAGKLGTAIAGLGLGGTLAATAALGAFAGAAVYAGVRVAEMNDAVNDLKLSVAQGLDAEVFDTLVASAKESQGLDDPTDNWFTSAIKSGGLFGSILSGIDLSMDQMRSDKLVQAQKDAEKLKSEILALGDAQRQAVVEELIFGVDGLRQKMLAGKMTVAEYERSIEELKFDYALTGGEAEKWIDKIVDTNAALGPFSNEMNRAVGINNEQRKTLTGLITGFRTTGLAIDKGTQATVEGLIATRKYDGAAMILSSHIKGAISKSLRTHAKELTKVEVADIRAAVKTGNLAEAMQLLEDAIKKVPKKKDAKVDVKVRGKEQLPEVERQLREITGKKHGILMDTGQVKGAQKDTGRTKESLEELDRFKAEPEVDVNDAKVGPSISAIERALNSIQDEDVFVNVIRRDQGGGGNAPGSAAGGVFPARRGGWVRRVSEAGQAEVITPVDKFFGMVDRAMQAGAREAVGGRGGGVQRLEGRLTLTPGSDAYVRGVVAEESADDDAFRAQRSRAARGR